MIREYTFKVKGDELGISAQELIDLSGNNIPEQKTFFLEAAQNAIDSVLGFVKVESVVKLYPLFISNENVDIGNKSFLVGKKITKLLYKSEYGAVFVTSAGRIFQEKSFQFGENGQLIESYFVDLLGSVTVEKGMDYIQNLLAEKLKQNKLKITNRYSPGYCDWHINTQKDLFSLINAQSINVQLLDSFLMYPSKTISGLIGVGTEVKFLKHLCDLCNSRDCIYRKRKASK